jgi:dTDP-4-amino-4,6-dideoxygalactose transaminase
LIPVTHTHLPNIKKFIRYVERIYANNWVTNNGPFVNELEERLRDYLGVPHIVLVNNGTLALHLAYRLLALEGRAITTPFSFVATTSSLVWEGLICDFADIDPHTLNMDPDRIRDLIRPDTSAIVPVHVFGNACEVERISEIAQRHRLKVIYDASHAFNVNYEGTSLLNFGDISTISFHATKLFHTIEGGALVMKDPDLYQRAKRMINFGFDAEGIPVELGINAKMNEFQAAMGLCMLDELPQILDSRAEVHETYMEFLRDVPGITFPEFHPKQTLNYAYFPVLFQEENKAADIKAKLERHEIYTRRYFYPSLEMMPYVHEQHSTCHSQYVTERILCLPMYDGLSRANIRKICNLLIEYL